MPHGAAAAASVNMAALIPYVLLAALFLIAMFVMHEDAVSAGRADARSETAIAQSQDARMEARVAQSKIEMLRNEVAELKGMNEAKTKGK